MMKAGIQKQTEHLELMKKYFFELNILLIDSWAFDFSIKIFANLREDILSKVADTLDEVSYADGEFIVRQGAKGDTFYIVAKGKKISIIIDG
jgi:cGMP-dependent protein kinase